MSEPQTSAQWRKKLREELLRVSAEFTEKLIDARDNRGKLDEAEQERARLQLSLETMVGAQHPPLERAWGESDHASRRAEERLQRVLGELALYYLVTGLRQSTAGPSPTYLNLVEKWHSWIVPRILAFHSAAALELLAGKALPGNVALIAFELRVKQLAENVSIANDEIAIIFSHFAWGESGPAGQSLRFHHTKQYADSELPLDLRSFVERPLAIVSALEAIDADIENVGAWIDELFTAGRHIFLHPQYRLFAKELWASLTATRSGKSSWFLHPERIPGVANAARGLNGAAELSSGIAQELEDARLTFLATLKNRVASAHLASDGAMSEPLREEAVLTLEHQIELCLYELWWRSLAFIETTREGTFRASQRLRRLLDQRRLSETLEEFPSKYAWCAETHRDLSRAPEDLRRAIEHGKAVLEEKEAAVGRARQREAKAEAVLASSTAAAQHAQVALGDQKTTDSATGASEKQFFQHVFDSARLIADQAKESHQRAEEHLAKAEAEVESARMRLAELRALSGPVFRVERRKRAALYSVRKAARLRKRALRKFAIQRAQQGAWEEAAARTQAEVNSAKEQREIAEARLKSGRSELSSAMDQAAAAEQRVTGGLSKLASAPNDPELLRMQAEASQQLESAKAELGRRDEAVKRLYHELGLAAELEHRASSAAADAAADVRRFRDELGRVGADAGVASGLLQLRLAEADAVIQEVEIAWANARERGNHLASAFSLGSTLRPPPDGSASSTPWKVTIFGAGIAGLTAAHELVERGFAVTVIEAVSDPLTRDPQVGGVARTQWTARPQSESGARSPRLEAPCDGSIEKEEEMVAGEHGYRFFPSFYRHVFDTMKRTPLPTKITGVHATALDQLVPTHQQVFARRRNYVPLSRTRPRSLEGFRREYMQLVEGLGFQPRDLSQFFFKLVRYLMTCSARREAEYQNKSFLECLQAERPYSADFLANIKAAPQALVAMDAEHCDARTQGNIYLQLLMDQVLGGEYTDGTLRGPTSTAWLDPWKEYLKRSGVKFVNGALLSIAPAPRGAVGGSMSVIIERPYSHRRWWCERSQMRPVGEADYYVVALDPVAAEQVTSDWGGWGVPRELRGFTSNVDLAMPPGLHRYELVATLAKESSRDDADKLLRQVIASMERGQIRADPGSPAQLVIRSLDRVTGEIDHNAEQTKEVRLTLWMRRRISEESILAMERAVFNLFAPSLITSVKLTSDQPEVTATSQIVNTPRIPQRQYGASPVDRFQTFTGIQYYFRHDFKLVAGHVYFPDTEWGLSAISQGQFWEQGQGSRGWYRRGFSNDRSIRAVLSVDIGDCRKKSSYTNKSFMESDPDDIAREVWRQISESLRTTRGPVAPVTNLPLPKWEYYHLDENLRFGGDALIANYAPFLINNIGDWEKRPKCMPWVPGTPKLNDRPRADAPDVWQAPHGGYRVHADKVVFCGHYMRTFTRMTTMEAANESARHAVNAILDHMAYGHGEHHDEGSSARTPIAGDYCRIWDVEQHELEDLEMFKRVDELLFKAGKPHIADILQFDKIADLQHPELSSGQALATALGSTIGKDWGVKAPDLVASLNSLSQLAGSFAQAMGAKYDAPAVEKGGLAGVLSGLGLGRKTTT